MIFKTKKHDAKLYTTLLQLSRNLNFYKYINLKDTFETRVYLMFLHFSIFLLIYKKKRISFPQDFYDGLFKCIENNLRELGLGDVGVNSKMKILNKIFYDILLKVNLEQDSFKINKAIILKYFDNLNETDNSKYERFEDYFTKFYHFCFELSPKTMIKDALKFKDH
ncbi:MAG: ubiquinol-cytochrome C chaperone family protein [Candidatus Pelagibacter sp.]